MSLSGKVTYFRPLHSPNALSPMDVTESGMVRVPESPLHVMNAFLPIDVIPGSCVLTNSMVEPSVIYLLHGAPNGP